MTLDGWVADLVGWFSLTTIAVVLGAVIAIETIGRWYRSNEWRRRMRDDDEG